MPMDLSASHSLMRQRLTLSSQEAKNAVSILDLLEFLGKLCLANVIDDTLIGHSWVGLGDIAIPDIESYTTGKGKVTERYSAQLWNVVEPIINKISISLLGESGNAQRLLLAILPSVPFDESSKKILADLFDGRLELVHNTIASLRSTSEKKQLLSIVSCERQIRADCVKLDRVLAKKKGIVGNRYQRWKANSHAKAIGPGAIVPKKERFRKKIAPEMLRKIVEFALQPENLQEVAYGTFSYKTDQSTFLVPAWQRTKLRTQLAREFLETLPKDTKKPSFRFVFTVLDKVSKKDLKSLAGLDEIAVKGKEAIDTIGRISKEFRSFCPDHLKPSVEMISSSAEFLKPTMKQHFQDSLQIESEIASHCVTFSLCGDEKPFKTTCKTCSSHDRICSYCTKVENLFTLGQFLQDFPSEDDQLNERLNFECQAALDDVIWYRSHLVREFHQGNVQNQTLTTLDSKTCYMVADWAMKFLSKFHREAQCDFFCKSRDKLARVCRLPPEALRRWIRWAV